jgi:hypothetical protein
MVQRRSIIQLAITPRVIQQVGRKLHKELDQMA